MNENFSFSVLPLLYAVLSVWNDDISFVSLQGIKRAKKKKMVVMSGSLRWFVNGKFVLEVGNDPFSKVKKKKVLVWWFPVYSSKDTCRNNMINANKVKLVNWGLYPRDRELSDSNKGIKRRKPALWLECLLRLNRVFVQSCWVKVPNVHFSHCLIFPVCPCLIVYCRATFYWLRGKLVWSLFAKQS